MQPLRLLDLFSGIGGFSLGLERSGAFKTVAFCEIEPFCRKVLAKHWPEVPCYHDVRELSAARLAADGIAVDAICGGFPCQDISVAGKGAGLAGERSGLWREYARLIGELRPNFVIVENVAALLGRGLADVLGDLATLGYDAEWHCIPASAVGAPHRRDRLWVIAHTHANGVRELQSERRKQDERRRIGDMGKNVSDTLRSRLERYRNSKSRIGTEHAAIGDPRWWSSEPSVGRMAYGISNRVDRLRGLGNAVVPQIPELIGRAIIASMQEAVK